jgi:hypothetical protein
MQLQLHAEKGRAMIADDLDVENWDALSYDDRLPFILACEDPAEWFERSALDALTGFRAIPWEWGKIKAVAKQRGVNV